MAVPQTIWIPQLLTEDGEHAVYDGAAFFSEEEAQKVLDIWRSEGRSEPMAVNLVPVYDTAADWASDR